MKISFENYQMFIAHRQAGLIDEKFKKCIPETVSGKVLEVIQSINVTEDIYNALKSDCGICLAKWNTVCYEFNRQRNSLFLIIYDDKANKPVEFLIENINGGIREVKISSTDNEDAEMIKSNMNCIHDEEYLGFVLFYLHLIVFKQLTDINLLIIADNKKYGFKKSRSNGEEDFSTNFKFPIRVLDSKYIRTLIRSGQFHVKGFFRLQPVGPMRRERRLTWVSEHVREKHNIMRQAI